MVPVQLRPEPLVDELRMESVRFRRPLRPGCEWLPASLGGQGLAERSDAVDRLGAPTLSTDGHVRLAALLLIRLARHPPGPHDPITLRRAARHVVRGLERRPHDAVLHRALGTVHLLLGDVEKGVAEMEVAQSLYPPHRDDVEVDLLRLCVDKGSHGDLGTRYERLLASEGHNDLFEVGAAAYEYGVLRRFDQARARLLEARQRFPESITVHIELAVVLWMSGDPTSALYNFSLIKDEHPDLPCVHWNYIAGLALTGNYATAEHELRSCSPSVAADASLRSIIDQVREAARPLSPPLSGDLSTVSLADILNLLWQCQSFGTLSIDSKKGSGGLHFWKGRLVGAVSPRFNLEALSPSNPLSPEGWLASDALGNGQIKVRDAVHQRVRSALEEMLEWKSGRFVFQSLEQSSFPGASAEVALDTPVVLLEAAADLDQRKR